MKFGLRNKNLSLALTIIFLCSIVLGTLPIQPAWAQFADIKGSWAEKQINDWADRGLAGGYSDGTFQPDNQITRAEFVALTNRAFGKQDETARADFKDVRESDWFYAEAAVAKAEGYCTGYTDGTFRPLNPVTRQEVASIVSRLLDLDAGTAVKAFADAGAIAPWARDAVNAVAAAGIMSGYTDGNFKGTNHITRAEAVVTLDRSMGHTAPAPAPSPASGITGSVILNGKAAAGAVVLLFAENGTEPIGETTSDKEGKYTFRVDAGNYDITAAKDKYVAYVAGVSFAGDGTIQDLALAEGTLINGRLVDENGSAVKNAKLFFTTNPTFLTTTGSAGDFSVYVPGGKKYTLRGYKNNKPASGLEILADDIEAGNRGTQSIGRISTSYALRTSSGGGGGGSSAPGAYTLTLSANPPAGGTVTDNTNAGPYTAGSVISLTAAASVGYQFVNWTAGDIKVSSDATFDYIMPAADTSLVGNFAPETPTDFAGGSGTESDPYQVATAGQLNKVRNYLDRNFVQTADIELGAAPWHEGQGWLPIGDSDNPFTGGYNGDGYSITELFIDRNTEHTGLFGYLEEGAQIAGVNVENAQVNGGDYTGILFGYAEKAVIIACNVQGSVAGGYWVAGVLAGGIENCEIRGCGSQGDVSAYYYAGGLVGTAEESSIIKMSYSTADVTDGRRIGGLVGNLSYSHVEGCLASGNVAGVESGGGLVHCLGGSSSVKSSYALGNVTVAGNQAGGLAAEMWGDSYVTTSYAMGDVSGQSGIGGIVGNPSSGDISHSIGHNFRIDTTNGSMSISRVAGNKSDAYNLFQNNHGYENMKVSGIPVSSNDSTSRNGCDFLGFHEIQAAEIRDPAPFEAWDFDALDADNNGIYWHWDDEISRPVLYVDSEGNDSYIRLGNDTKLIEPVDDDIPSDFAGGDGSVDNPYQIATAQQLEKVRDYLDKHFIQVADIDLGVAPWNEGEGWEPIGTSDNKFSGSFDGDGYKITNLTMNYFSGEGYGLFGAAGSGASFENCAVFKNIALEDVNITANLRVGSLLGMSRAPAVVIDNCYATGSITANIADAGGLVGSSQGVISNSYADVTINGSAITSGGLVGQNSGNVTNCYALGNVTGTEDLGGLIGFNGGNIANSYSTGNVTGTIFVGGVAGIGHGIINQCFSSGSVNGAQYIGGLVGGGSANVNDSYATGSVTGSSNVGGLFGLLENGSVNNSFATGEVTGSGGGLIGSVSSATCSNSYYDTETTGKWDNFGKGIPKTTAEMVDQNTFTDWDFNTIWAIDNDPASYPYLKWQNEEHITYPPSVFAGGFGTVDDPYEVATAEQLNKVRDYPGKHFIQTANIDLTGYLGVDGPEYNDGAGWRQIGNRYTSFNGTFNGNDYVISNLFINRPDDDYQGLFGCTGNDAELTGMALDSLDVTGYSYVGGLVGQNNGHIEDCYTTGTVTGTYTQIGGLVGYNYAYSGAVGSIINSHSSADVTGHEEAGGLVGYNSGGLISGCHASGDVMGVKYDDDESEQVGGLVGDSGGRIEDSYASGKVSGYEDVGGLAGSSGSEIDDCYATGIVSGTNEVGGLVGYNSSAIDDCHASGNVSGVYQVGGLVGNSYGNITNSYAIGHVEGYEYLGGLIGYSAGGKIQASFAAGNVTMKSGVEDAVGGLAGSIQNTLVDDCYATGNVTGHAEVGGLVGYVSVEAEVNNCYAVGSVTKLNTTSYSLGGLIGATTSPTQITITDSYYDQETTGQTDNGLGLPKTTEEMKQLSTYTGWDFAGIWGINPDENDGYPFLRWQGYEHVSIPVLDENFDSYAVGGFPSIDGWVLMYSGAGVGEQSVTDYVYVSGEQSLHLKGVWNEIATAYKTVDIPAKGVLEGWVRTDAAAGLPGGVAHIGLVNPDVGTGGTRIASVIFADGKIYANDSSYELQVFETDTWYHVGIIYDLDERTVDFYVDGDRLAGNVPIGLVTPTAVFLSAGNGGTANGWYDDIILRPGTDT
ncbi:MAG: hypothetical protein VR67_02010 [Peptococcaceae bacterium BRH_c8a]|nr:MAG: hypothetical protein VR67_02010 [Peptococcaceae bacterium BRH_c8a]